MPPPVIKVSPFAGAGIGASLMEGYIAGDQARQQKERQEAVLQGQAEDRKLRLKTFLADLGREEADRAYRGEQQRIAQSYLELAQTRAGQDQESSAFKQQFDNIKLMQESTAVPDGLLGWSKEDRDKYLGDQTKAIREASVQFQLTPYWTNRWLQQMNSNVGMMDDLSAESELMVNRPDYAQFRPEERAIIKRDFIALRMGRMPVQAYNALYPQPKSDTESLVQVTHPDGSVTYEPKTSGLAVKPPLSQRAAPERLYTSTFNQEFPDGTVHAMRSMYNATTGKTTTIDLATLDPTTKRQEYIGWIFQQAVSSVANGKGDPVVATVPVKHWYGTSNEEVPWSKATHEQRRKWAEEQADQMGLEDTAAQGVTKPPSGQGAPKVERLRAMLKDPALTADRRERILQLLGEK